jgi:methyltransferase (TIGR00027 family)
VRDGAPSSTAQRVAAHRLRFQRIGAPYGDPGADDRLAHDVASDVAVDPRGPMVRYLDARTRYFDRVVVDAIDAGVEQIVVAGAGYDARSLRYAKPGVAWFEADHPDTQHDKLARLATLQIAAGGVHFVPADFKDGDLAARLWDAGLDRTRPTLFVCEGVSVYLDDDILAVLLGELSRAGGPGSRLAISLSIAATTPEARERRARFEARVARVGEAVRSTLTVDDADDLLARCGWVISATAAGSEDESRGHDAGLVLLDRAPSSSD